MDRDSLRWKVTSALSEAHDSFFDRIVEWGTPEEIYKALQWTSSDTADEFRDWFEEGDDGTWE